MSSCTAALPAAAPLAVALAGCRLRADSSCRWRHATWNTPMRLQGRIVGGGASGGAQVSRHAQLLAACMHAAVFPQQTNNNNRTTANKQQRLTAA